LSEANPIESSDKLSKADCFLELPVSKYSKEGLRELQDKIIREQQMSIILDGRMVYSFTCLPLNIEELAIGYLYLQGLISHKEQLDALRVDVQAGVVEVNLRSLPGLGEAVMPLLESKLQLSASEVSTFATLLENISTLFQETGGVHSAALIKGNSIVVWFEDIGRHSVVDKLAGWCVLNDYKPHDCILLFSGRVPNEIITKVIKMGCPVIISPGAPTDLSITLAQQHGVTIIGFAKRRQFNVYSHPERVIE